ncbi:MAG: KH domain-containing protein [Nanoarchaeota archaeon]|nr:KH domain-containing protein [Nanoarchaeota archaeon]
MEEFMYELRIPKDRIAVVIGKEGVTKNHIEKYTKTKIDIDSKEGEIILTGKDALGLYSAREVVTSIGRGFNPDVALLLLKPDYVYDTINMADYVGNSKDHLQRIRGRVIGREGKSRQLIEELTETYVVVYGKTVGIIGLADYVPVARAAVDMLLGGSPHVNVFKMMERKRRDLKREQLMGVELKDEFK